MQGNSIVASLVGSQIVGLFASRRQNSLPCLDQGTPLPSSSVASGPIDRVMPARAAPAAGRSATEFPGTSAAAPVSDHGSAVLGIASVRMVVGKGMKLEADGIGYEGVARQAGPLDRALCPL